MAAMPLVAQDPPAPLPADPAPAAASPAAAAPSAPSTPMAAPSGPTKIAVIAFQAAVGQTNEFQRSFADLQKKYDPKRQQLKSLNDEVEAKTKALQTDGEKLSDAERATRAKEIDDRKKQLQRSAEDAENDFQQEMQQLFATTAQKFYDVLSTYSQQQGYSLVLDVATQQSPVMYAVPSTDITKQVLEAYNTKSGVPPPPPPAPGAAAPAQRTPGAAPRTPGTAAPRPTTPKAPARTPAGK